MDARRKPGATQQLVEPRVAAQTVVKWADSKLERKPIPFLESFSQPGKGIHLVGQSHVSIDVRDRWNVFAALNPVVKLVELVLSQASHGGLKAGRRIIAFERGRLVALFFQDERPAPFRYRFTCQPFLLVNLSVPIMRVCRVGLQFGRLAKLLYRKVILTKEEVKSSQIHIVDN